MADFTHLHVHSHYSLLDGLGKIDLLLQKAKDLNMSAIAITDHGVMYGIIEFIRKAKTTGVKPIVGMETYLAPLGRQQRRGKIDSQPRHLTLLAQNNQGYQNLIKLATSAQLEGFYYKPRIDYEVLEKYHEGLIVLSGCLNGDISRAILEKRPDDVKRLIEWHLNVLGRERFYLEVQHHPNLTEQKTVNEVLFEYGKKYRLGVVATGDSHYINPEDAEAQDVLVCVQTGKTVQEKDRLSMLDEDYSLKSQEQMKQDWKDHPEVLDNSMKIAESCHVELEFYKNKLPRYPLPPKITADNALREMCEKNLAPRYSGDTLKTAKERLRYELEVIAKTGYASYFLIVADFVNEAKRRGIMVGPGRGSAAGSLVAYLTNITGIDPLRYNLLFERFLNPERVSMPDIDLDFADDRRDEVIEYVRQKYGSEHVAQIITFGTMAARAAVRDSGRALGFPYAFCDKVAKTIPAFTNFEEALQGGELKEMYDTDPQVRRLVDTAKKLEGVCRHASTHAAGVVITEKPLTEYVPLQFSSNADKTGEGGTPDTVTQYAMGEVEALGLLKMDFLGLKNLTIIQHALRQIKIREGKELDLNNLPLDDKPSYQLLQEGKTIGVFQLESAGMRRYLKELKPSEFEDIISMVALYRPGPMDSIPDFIAAKQGRKRITYLHPLLKPILEKTYGVIVTQDQVLQIAREFSGFTYAEADILRKAVGKKIKELLDEQREKFIQGAREKKGIDLQTAVKVWDFIEPFARYGFNRAHAACYAMIAYQTAYLKAHYPAEFMAALLTSDEGNTDRQAVEVAEAMAIKIKVLPPDINESGHDFTVVADEGKQAIRFGLNAIKNVGHNVVTAIIQEREEQGRFQDLFDTFRRMHSRDFNRKSVESLVKAGAFDRLAERQAVLHNTERLLEFNRELKKQTDAGQRGLFGEKVQLAAPKIALEEVAPASKETKLNWEKELLGLYLSEHPLLELATELEQIATPMNEITNQANKPGEGVRVAGVITRIKKIMTKKQQPMMFVTLEDMVGKMEVLVFPKLLEKTGESWIDGAKLLVEGKLSDKDSEFKLLADKVWTLNKENLKELKGTLKATKKRPVMTTWANAKQLTIQVAPSVSRESLVGLQNLLAQYNITADKGMAVRLAIPQNGGVKLLATSYYLPREEKALTAIARVVGQQALRYF